jgi:methionyl aminopeptidase
MIPIKNTKEIEKMRAVNRLVAETHAHVKRFVRQGVTTKELDAIAEDFILMRGAKPNFKNYNGYPAATCISVNDTVIHGIPDGCKLEEGDLVSLDFGAVLDGYHGDAARSYLIGKASGVAQRLLTVTRQCFYEALKEAKAGRRTGDIAAAVQTLAEQNGFSVVRAFTGHGIGRKLHEDPAVPNFGIRGQGALLKAGMTLAVEPMINEGKPDVKILSDRWTVKTADGGLSAHYENTVLITHGEPEILSDCGGEAW